MLPENASDVASVINNRTGNVLGRGTILKSDHFPGCQRKGMEVMVDQAPNYRKVSGMEVYGVAIPTVEGICNVLDLLDSGIEGNSWVTWVSLREEPVSYAIGRPFVCRDSSRPFENLEHTGISTVRVENMEDEIVKDLIAEADRYSMSCCGLDSLTNCRWLCVVTRRNRWGVDGRMGASVELPRRRKT